MDSCSDIPHVRIRRTIAYLVLLAMFATAACKKSGGATTASGTSRPTVWDLSNGEEISRVNWPKDWPLDRFTFEGPGEIEVVLLGGERHRLTPDQVYVARVGGRLTVVSFELPPMKLDHVYSEAIRLAAEWRITDLEELKKWYSKRQLDGGNTADVRWIGIGNLTLPRPRGLEVRPSYNPELPWTIRIGFGWPDNDPRSVESRKAIEESYRKGHRSSPQ